MGSVAVLCPENIHTQKFLTGVIYFSE